MARDILYRRPWTARIILIVGAVILFGLCWLLFVRGGYREALPVWLAVQWMWVPPVFISAAFDRWSKWRLLDLISYALVTAFTVSWTMTAAGRSSKAPIGGPIEAMIGLTSVGPAMLLGVGIVEAASRGVLDLMRRFVPRPCCGRCGYLTRGLTRPECPECGEALPAFLLDPSAQIEATPIWKRWTALAIALAVTASVAFPPLYHLHFHASLRADGKRRAEEDWAAGEAVWYVTIEEEKAMARRRSGRYFEMSMFVLFERDTVAGLTIGDPRIRSDIWEKTWHRAYREVIERKLAEAGKEPPKF